MNGKKKGGGGGSGGYLCVCVCVSGGEDDKSERMLEHSLSFSFKERKNYGFSRKGEECERSFFTFLNIESEL